MKIGHYCSIAVACYLISACQPARFEHEVPAASAKPWSSEQFNDHEGDFEFVVFGDRTGLARPGVFEQAMPRINLLQPEFVINTGDMIEGYTDDSTELLQMWDEQDARLSVLTMPFFRVVGNHDIGSDVMRDFWKLRYGPDYYSFVYKNVLFIALNTEDPPTPMPPEMRAGFDMVKQKLRENPEEAMKFMAQSMASMTPEMRANLRNTATPARFSSTQVEWLKQTLATHAQTRVGDRRLRLRENRSAAGGSQIQRLRRARAQLRTHRAQRPRLRAARHGRRRPASRTARQYRSPDAGQFP
jgi:hypothetical protein